MPIYSYCHLFTNAATHFSTMPIENSHGSLQPQSVTATPSPAAQKLCDLQLTIHL